MSNPIDAEISASLARWRRDRGHDLPAQAADFVVERVAAAGPATAKEARVAANYLGEYVSFRLASGLAVDCTMFEAAAIEEYRKTALADVPKNSRAPRVSYIKRLSPNVGLRGTTRGRTEGTPPLALVPNDTPAPEPSQAVESAAVHPLVRPEVARAIDGFVSKVLDPARFARVRPLVRDVVRRANPESPKRARDLMRTVSYAAAWLDEDRRPLRADVLLAARTIEEFVGVLEQAVPTGSVATYVGQMHALREAHGIDLDVARTPFGARRRMGLYDAAEVDALYHATTWIPTEKRRRQLCNLFDLVFGAGATPKDASHVQPSDVRRVERGVVVTLSGREVLMLEPYGAQLLAHAQDAAECGDRYLVGGAGSRIKRIPALLGRVPSGKHGIDFDLLRARDTWLVAAFADARWHSPAEFIQAAGRGALARLQRLGYAGVLGASGTDAAALDDAEEEAS